VAEANDHLAGQVKLFEDVSGLSLAELDWRLPDEISEAARQQVESLSTIRDLLDHVCVSDQPDVKDCRTLALMAVRGEKILWKELVDSQYIVSQERLVAIFKSFTAQLIAFAKPRINDENRWGEIVDQVLSHNGYQPALPETRQP
jgi:hypothetical protein